MRNDGFVWSYASDFWPGAASIHTDCAIGRRAQCNAGTMNLPERSGKDVDEGLLVACGGGFAALVEGPA